MAALRLAALLAAVLALPPVAAAAPQFPATPAPETLPFPITANIGYFSAAVLPDGEAAAAWYDFATDEVLTARREPGGTWIRERVLFDGGPFNSAHSVKVAADAAGNVTAVFIGGDHVSWSYRPAGGEFGAPVEVGAVLADEDLVLAVGADGRGLAVWTTSTGTVMGIHRGPGATAFDPTVDTVSASDGDTRVETDAVFTSAGRAVVAWRNLTDDDIDFAKRDPEDTSFDAESSAYAASPQTTGDPVLAADGVGGAHLLFWTRSTGPDRTDVWGKALPAGAAIWTGSEPVASLTGTTSKGSAALVGAPDGAATALVALPDGTLVSETRPPGAPWPSAQAAPVTGGADASRLVALHRGPGGALTGLYGTSTGEPRAVTREPGGGWSAPLPLAAGDELQEPALASNAAGDVLATWTHSPPGVDALRAVAGDSGAPPRVTLTAPGTLTAGQSGAFGLGATDFTGIASTSVAFGDGTSAPGPAPSHAYAAPGAYGVTGTAVDGRGNSAAATATVSVTAPPASGGGAGPGGAPRPAGPARRRTRRPDVNLDRIPRRVRAARLRAFGGRASDELGVARVEVALVRLRGGARFTATASARRCDALRADGRLRRTRVRRGRCAPSAFLRATGTTRWTFRLRRRLPRGSYVLVARARATDGAVERGFSAGDRNLARFTVR